VNKTINLTGEDRDTTIIDGGGNGDVVNVNADWVNMSGFLVRNSGIGDYPNYYTGIELKDVQYCKINNNNISNNMYGILLNSSSNNNITNNILILNDYSPIALYSSSNNNILNNTILDNEGGIYLGDSSNNTILSNIISKVSTGVHLLMSSYNYIISNNISNNSRGIYLGSSSNNSITNNNVTSNSWLGIHLDSSSDNNITNNIVTSNNDYGIYLESSHQNSIISCNLSLNSQTALKMDFSDNNEIINSNIVNGWSNGVFLAFSSNNNFTNCEISNNGDGIQIYALSNHNSITNCNISSNDFRGIFFSESSNNTLTNSQLNFNTDGVGFSSPSINNLVKNCSISNNNNDGIRIYEDNPDNNTIMNNTIDSNNRNGIFISDSFNNTITRNYISLNLYGVNITKSLNNTVFHNNFIENIFQALDDTSNNTWNNSYPSGGNYWSDWSPITDDLYNGAITPQTSGSPDGICDFQYNIDSDSTDYYPLKNPVDLGLPDFIPPTITNLLPPDASTINVSTPTISAGYSDFSGINTSSVVLKVDNLDETANATVTASDVTYTPTLALPDGGHTVYLEVKDIWNNLAITSWSFIIDTTPPAAITDLSTSNITNDSITLSWTTPGDDGDTGTAFGYIIKYSTSGPITDSNWTSATTYPQSWTPLSAGNTEIKIVSGLSQGAQYWFAIKAYDDVSNYAEVSNSPNGTTVTTPSAPQNIQASSGDGFVNLTWNAPSSDGGSAIVEYNIYRNDTAGVYDTILAGQLWYNDTNVINGLTYSYNVSAFNDFAEGPKSTDVSGSPLAPYMAPPSAPRNLQANAGDGYIYIFWTEPSNEGSSPITNYRIYRGTNSSEETFLTEIGDIRNYNDTSVTNDVTYYYKVSAQNIVGEGQLSNEVNATPQASSVTPKEPSDKDAEFPWLGFLAALVIAVIAIILVIYFLTRKKKEDQPPNED